MSEQKTYMQQLDDWASARVITPLYEAFAEGDSADCDAACAEVKKAIRERVLESYRNGVKAGAKPTRKEPRR